MNHKALVAFSTLIMTALIGCGSDKTTSPGLAIAGNYRATRWVTTNGSGQTDQLNAGSTLLVSLAENGTMSGHLHVAASGGSPALDADMAGTWIESGDAVTFTQAADTFVRNLTFNIVANGIRWSLSANQVINSTNIEITLDQVP